MRVPTVQNGGHQKRIQLNNGSIPALALLNLTTISNTTLEPAS